MATQGELDYMYNKQREDEARKNQEGEFFYFYLKHKFAEEWIVVEKRTDEVWARCDDKKEAKTVSAALEQYIYG